MSPPPLELQPDCPEITAWQPAPTPPPLEDGELHLWKLDAPENPPPAPDQQPLSSQERERASEIRNPDVRNTFIHSRCATRRILGGYLGIEPGALRFAYGPLGKPHIDHSGAALKFNLTHSGRLCLLAVMRNLEVGLDTERVRERRGMEAIAVRMFDAERVRYLASLPEQQRQRMFYLYWSRMEAVVKARGGGLFDGHSLESAVMPHACFIPHPGFQACVAVDGPCPPPGGWRTLLFDGGAESRSTSRT
jgi:4'-phosphopantetheinyl transferase